jgi:hypothetical protein
MYKVDRHASLITIVMFTINHISLKVILKATNLREYCTRNSNIRSSVSIWRPRWHCGRVCWNCVSCCFYQNRWRVPRYILMTDSPSLTVARIVRSLKHISDILKLHVMVNPFLSYESFHFIAWEYCVRNYSYPKWIVILIVLCAKLNVSKMNCNSRNKMLGCFWNLL